MRPLIVFLEALLVGLFLAGLDIVCRVIRLPIRPSVAYMIALGAFTHLLFEVLGINSAYVRYINVQNKTKRL